MKSVRVPAFAKVNLCLDVLERRADGYHELRTVFQSISLHDTLELELRPKTGIDLQVLGDGSLSGVPCEENLVYRALRDLSAAIGLTTGVRAVLTKRIPVGRGLGGGSSDAAAALLGLLKLTRQNIETPSLLEIAATLGADVPFFLYGGRALGIGRGTEVYPLSDLKRLNVLVVSPNEITVPTKEAYQWLSQGLPRELTNGDEAHKLFRFCALCWSPQGGALSNDFEAAVFPRYPRLAAIKRELLRQGAAEASLAGSGSAVFGVYQNPATARRAARSFPKDQVFLCSTLARAEYRRKVGGPDLV